MLQNSPNRQQKMRQNDRNDSLRHNSFSGGLRGWRLQMWNTLGCSCPLTQLSILEGEPKKVHAKEPRGARKAPLGLPKSEKGIKCTFLKLKTPNFISKVLMGKELIARGSLGHVSARGPLGAPRGNP